MSIPEAVAVAFGVAVIGAFVATRVARFLDRRRRTSDKDEHE